jgi:DNA-directed RNA polymerase subunit alpha
MRVGKRTDYDRIILEIKTDGTITPEEAYEEAVKVLLDQFNAISKVEEFKEEIEIEETKKTKADKNAKKDFEISALELSTRIHNVLESNELTKVSEVAKLSEKELRNLSGMGNKGVDEIKNSIKNFGYSLKKND